MLSLILSFGLQALTGHPPQGKLHCYDVLSPVGTAAVEEFTDPARRVEKRIFYDSPTPWDPGTMACARGTLRVQETRTYLRDAEGREIVEKRYGRDGRLLWTWTLAYEGPGRDAYTRTSFGPNGERQEEVRVGKQTHTKLLFDKNGRVAAVEGPLPSDVDYSVAWGPVVDGWSCGLGVPAMRTEPGEGLIVVNLRNFSDHDRQVWITEAFETELRDEAGRVVPLTEAYLALQPSLALSSRTGIHVGRNGAAFFRVDLHRRYGRLWPGRYTLVVRHAHPETAATLVSNALAFELPFR